MSLFSWVRLKELVSINGRFQMLSQYLRGVNEEKYEDSQDTLYRDRDLNPGPSEYEAEALLLIILKLFFSGNKAAGT
jgi:hypothetical protein